MQTTLQLDYIYMVTFCKTFLFLQHYRRSIGPNQEYENNFKRYI